MLLIWNRILLSEVGDCCPSLLIDVSKKSAGCQGEQHGSWKSFGDFHIMDEQSGGRDLGRKTGI